MIFEIKLKEKLFETVTKPKKIEARERIMKQSRVEERQVATQERQKAPQRRHTTIDPRSPNGLWRRGPPRGALARAGYT